MNKPAVTLWLLAGPLWGCTTQDFPAVSVRQALQERDAAYVRVVNAIGSYCAVGRASLESRQHCMVEKLVALRSEQAREDSSSARSLHVNAPNRLFSVRCERTRVATTCQRRDPPVAPFGENGRRDVAVGAGLSIK